MSNNDLVVVIPGIGGSTLERGTIPLWSTKPGKLITALTVLTTHLQTLQLLTGSAMRPPTTGAGGHGDLKPACNTGALVTSTRVPTTCTPPAASVHAD